VGKEMGHHRYLSFSFDDRIEPPKPISDVLPQGSPSSPILFAIMAVAIMEIPPPKTIPPFGFGRPRVLYHLVESLSLSNSINYIIC
jgi:hypothetical protein